MRNRFDGGRKMWPFSRAPAAEYVTLSIGIVGYRALTHGDVVYAFKRATVAKDLVNYAFLFDAIEQRAVLLSKQKRMALSVEDGVKLRAKTREILVRHGLIPAESVKVVRQVETTDEDDEAIRQEHAAQLARLRAKIGAMNGA